MSRRPQTIAECIKQAYADVPDRDDYQRDARCLSFCAPDWVNPERAAELVDLIGTYNRFSPESVGERLLALDDSARVAIGREGSPVLYIESLHADAVIDRFEGYADECYQVDYVGNATTWADDDGYDAHTMCRHDEPPVPVADYAETADDERRVVRAWWD